MPLIAVLGKQRQEDLCELEASLVYRVSSRTARATQGNPVLKQQQSKSHVNIYCIYRWRVCKAVRG